MFTNSYSKNMKYSFIPVAIVASLLLASACSDANMQKNEQGNYVVNTTDLGKEVKGFAGQTPLVVTIDKNGTIVNVEALPNSETPEYFRSVEGKMLQDFVGKNAQSIAEVDGVSGATFSSRAIKSNVQLAVDYYQQHK